MYLLRSKLPQEKEIVTGRTVYDVLSDSKIFIRCFLLLVLFVIVSYFYQDAVISAIDVISSFVSANYLYALPIFAGFYVGRHTYLKYIRGGVNLEIIGLDTNKTAVIEVSKSRFNNMTPENGAFNPRTASDGNPLFVCKSVDLVNNKIDLGDCHLAGDNPVVYMTYSSKLWAMIKDYRVKCSKLVELQSLPFVIGHGIGKKVVKKHLEFISPVDISEFLNEDDIQEGDSI